MIVVLLSIGHMMTTATLVCKIFRVKVLLDAGTNVRRVEVTVRQVSVFIIVFVGLDAVVLLLWYIMDPFSWHLESSGEDLTVSGYITRAYGTCSSDGELSYLYPATIGMFHLGVLVYGNILAYQTSAFHKISDSKSIAIALFNSIQLLLIGAPILALVGNNVATSYLIRICFVFLNNFGALVLIVLPKLYQCVMGMGDQLPEVDFAAISRKRRVTQSGGGQRSKSRSSTSGNNNKPSNIFDEEDVGNSRFKTSVRASFKTPLPFSGAMPSSESALRPSSNSRMAVNFAEEYSNNSSGHPLINNSPPVNDDVFKFGKARDTFSTTDWSEAPNDSNSTPSDDENQENLTAPTSIETSKSQASDLKTKTVQGSVFDVVDDYHVKDDDNKEVVDAAVARLTRSSGSLSNSLRHCT